MTWNLRVILHTDPDQWYGIHECYYNNYENPIPHSWGKNTFNLTGDSVEDFKWMIEVAIPEALKKPVLEIVDDRLVEVKDGDIAPIYLTDEKSTGVCR